MLSPRFVIIVFNYEAVGKVKINDCDPNRINLRQARG